MIIIIMEARLWLVVGLLGALAAQTLNFTVVGDFGLVEDLSYADKLFDAIDAHTANGHPFSFFVTVGDNVYPNGITEKNAEALKTVMDVLFGKSNLSDKPVYPTLGNHDCYGDSQAMVDSDLENWEFGGADYYVKSFDTSGALASDGALASLFFLNGCLLTCKGKASSSECQRMGVENEQQVDAHYDWLEDQLSRSTSKWTILLDHYQIHSLDDSGDRGDTTRYLLPLVMDHGVDIFLLGHSHDMQYMTYSAASQQRQLSSSRSSDMQCARNTEILYEHTRVKEFKKGDALHEVLVGASGMPPSGEEEMSAVCANPNTVSTPHYAFNARRAYARVEVSDQQVEVIYLDDQNTELFRSRIMA